MTTEAFRAHVEERVAYSTMAHGQPQGEGKATVISGTEGPGYWASLLLYAVGSVNIRELSGTHMATIGYK